MGRRDKRTSASTRAKMSVSLKERWASGKFGKNSGGQCAKGVACFFKEGGPFLKWFWCAAEAGRQTGISRHNIGKVCVGRQKTAGGLVWKFMEKPP